MKKRGRFHVLNIERVSEERQGLIFYICRNLELLTPEKRRIVDDLILRIGGDNAEALRRFVTTDDSAQSICTQYYIGSTNTLCNLRRRFFLEFPLEDVVSD